MNFEIIPIAEASIKTLVGSINKVIINPIIIFLFACALGYFLFGVAQYLMSPDNEEIRKKSKTQMVSGLVGLFIMVAVFGIMTLIGKTVQSDITIQQSGNVIDNSSSGFVDVNTLKEVDNNLNGITLTEDTYNSNIETNNYTPTNNISNAGIYGGIVGEILLTIINSEANKKEYSGDLIYPIQEETNWSAKQTQFTGKYPLNSNGAYYYVIGSGINSNNRMAKDIAVRNALIELARLKNITATTKVTYKIIDESNYTIDNRTGYYDYFVVLESPK
jgi:hypothetical protein